MCFSISCFCFSLWYSYEELTLYKLEHHSMLRLAFLHCLTTSLIVGGLGVDDHTNILLEALVFLMYDL